MKTTNKKWMKATGILVILICCIWIGLGSIMNVLSATVFNGGYMKWNPDCMTWQIYIIAGYLLTSVGFAAVISILIYKILSGFIYMFLVNFRPRSQWSIGEGVPILRHGCASSGNHDLRLSLYNDHRYQRGERLNNLKKEESCL